MDEYKCTQCGELKLKTEFYKNRSKKDGVSSECKTCRKGNNKYKGYSRKHHQTIRGRLNQILYSAKIRAAKRNLVYQLDYEWLSNLYNNQNGRCLLTQLELSFNSSGDRCQQPFSPSLDRINPKKGYTKENTRLVCTAINVALNQHGEDIFREVAESYLRHLAVPRVIMEKELEVISWTLTTPYRIDVTVRLDGKLHIVEAMSRNSLGLSWCILNGTRYGLDLPNEKRKL